MLLAHTLPLHAQMSAASLGLQQLDSPASWRALLQATLLSQSLSLIASASASYCLCISLSLCLCPSLLLTAISVGAARETEQQRERSNPRGKAERSNPEESDRGSTCKHRVHRGIFLCLVAANPFRRKLRSSLFGQRVVCSTH